MRGGKQKLIQQPKQHNAAAGAASTDRKRPAAAASSSSGSLEDGEIEGEVNAATAATLPEQDVAAGGLGTEEGRGRSEDGGGDDGTVRSPARKLQKTEQHQHRPIQWHRGKEPQQGGGKQQPQGAAGGHAKAAAGSGPTTPHWSAARDALKARLASLLDEQEHEEELDKLQQQHAQRKPLHGASGGRGGGPHGAGGLAAAAAGADGRGYHDLVYGKDVSKS